MSVSLLAGKTLCVITGASQGFGRCLAESLATRLQSGSFLLLLARNTDKLAEVTAQLKSLNDKVRVAWNRFDQSDVKDCSHGNIQKVLGKAEVNLKEFDSVILIHNAGTTGDLTKYSWDYLDENMVTATMNTNVTGLILLNAALMMEMRKHDIKVKVIVNLSSLAAIQAFPSWSLYCAGKAARDMYFLTIAKEDPSLRVLNWAPGPLDTDMQAVCRGCADPTLKQTFSDMHKNGQLLTCEQSVKKLLMVLEKNTFQSGQHLDYYDV